MAQPYSKTVNAPIKPPDTSQTLAAGQIPENVLWLPDGRGFQRRPGTCLGVDSTTNPNYVTALLATQTGSPKLSLGTELVFDLSVAYSTELLVPTKQIAAIKWGLPAYAALTGQEQETGLFQIQQYKAFLASGDKKLMRGVDRDDDDYYFGTPGSNVAVSPSTVISNVASGTTYNTFGQLSLPALSLVPDNRYGDRQFPASKMLPANKLSFVPGAEGYAPRDALNTQRIDAISDEGGMFIGGGGGPITYFDGFRNHVLGPFDMSSRVSGTLSPFILFGTPRAVGTFTGTYNYKMTHVYVTSTGEEVESAPTTVSANVVALNNVYIGVTYSSYGGTIFPDIELKTGLHRFTYKMRSFDITSVVVGTQSAVFTISGYHDLKVGERISFHKASGVRGSGTIATSSDSVVTVVYDTATRLAAITAADAYTISVNGFFRLYRNKTAGTVFYKIADIPLTRISGINDGLAFEFADSALDSALVTEYAPPAFSTDATPAVTHSITIHQGRLVAIASSANSYYTRFDGYPANPTTKVPLVEPTQPYVAFSPASSFQYMPVENRFNLPVTAGNGLPKAVISVDDILYIFTEEAIFYVTGVLGNVGEYSVHLLTDHVGCRDARSVIRVGSEIFFMSNLGLAQISGTSISMKAGIPVRAQLLRANTTTSCHYWAAKNLLLVSANDTLEYRQDTASELFSPSTQRQGSDTPAGLYRTVNRPQTYVYSLSADRWSVWDVDCYNGAVEDENGDLLLAPGIPYDVTAATQILRMSDKCNWTDSGRPFTTRFYSEWFDGGMPAVDKQFNRLLMYSTDTPQSGGQGFALRVRTERDWSVGSTVDQTDLVDFAISGWGETPWDSTPWGDPERPYKVLPLSNQKMRSVRVILENSEVNGDMCINALALESAEVYENAKDYS